MNKYINHLRGLDILRLILSFAIIIWHYQHFFQPFVPDGSQVKYLEKQPFYNYFQVFYLFGNFAVQFFWLVSGIIFYKIYHEKLVKGAISFKAFFVKRFSRLYPLHLLTLLIVLFLQHVYFNQSGRYFIYEQNSIKELFFNLLFIQSWGVNKFSFNGPTWSVSVEILAYLIFFIIASSRLISGYSGLIFTVLFFTILKKWELVFFNDDLAGCLFFFFIGCLFIKMFEDIRHSNTKLLITWFLFLAVFALSLYNAHRPENFYHTLSGHLNIDVLSLSLLVVLSFLLFFNLRIFDKAGNRFFSTLGNMTYSTYLAHFPLQLTLMLIFKPSSYTFFYSNTFFLSYLSGTLLLGYLIFHFFERPVQQFLRRRSAQGPEHRIIA